MALKKCACIDTLYTELPFEERLAAARRDGFDGVDFWDWWPHDICRLRDAADACGIRINSFDGDAGYSLVDPDQRGLYLDFLGGSLEAAKVLGAESLSAIIVYYKLICNTYNTYSSMYTKIDCIQ